MGEQFHFHPDTYLDLVLAEVPAYVQLQDAVAEGAAGLEVRSILELGAGTGERPGAFWRSILGHD